MPTATRAGRLSRDKIIAAVTELLESEGVDAVSTRTIGEALSVHPTALYRHFRDMDELLREAADSIMAGLVERMPAVGDGAGLDGASAVCRDLRQVLMTHPGAARVMASGPSRMENERAFTERLLGLLGEAGLSDEDTVFGYHALVEFTVGSAAIDAIEPAPSSDEEAARHRRWRADYLTASPDAFPQTVRLANELYPSMSEQFEFGLDLLIAGLRQRVAG
jgi:TetR/AcrR family tetracycline transcriptional repressor